MSLISLDASFVSNLNSTLTQEFFVSLGDNTSLKTLNLSNSGTFSSTQIEKLGSAIAFNNIKKGCLEELFLEAAIPSYINLSYFIKGMFISEKKHVEWYNAQFNPNIPKDKKEYFDETFYGKLSFLDISKGNFIPDFSINDIKNKKENNIKPLFEKTGLVDLRMEHCTFNKNFIELLVNTLHEKNTLETLSLKHCWINGEKMKELCKLWKFDQDAPINSNCILKQLDLSLNKFGYSGIMEISRVLTYENNPIKSLNLFHNIFDVNGARRLAEALEVNSTLESIDIGYNRIKDIGLVTILESLSKNKNTKLKHLGCKYNFIRSNCFTNFYEKLHLGEYKLSSIEFSNNLIDEKTIHTLYDLYHKKSENEKNAFEIKCDIFELVPYMDSKRMERTVWISPISYLEKKNNIANIIKEAEKSSILNKNEKLGIFTNISIKRGRKTGHKKDNANSIGFIEFICPNSANMMLKIASTTGISINGKRIKVFKAGTRKDFILVKKSIYTGVNVPTRDRVRTNRARGGFRGSRGGRGSSRGARGAPRGGSRGGFKK